MVSAPQPTLLTPNEHGITRTSRLLFHHDISMHPPRGSDICNACPARWWLVTPRRGRPPIRCHHCRLSRRALASTCRCRPSHRSWCATRRAELKPHERVCTCSRACSAGCQAPVMVTSAVQGSSGRVKGRVPASRHAARAFATCRHPCLRRSCFGMLSI